MSIAGLIVAGILTLIVLAWIGKPFLTANLPQKNDELHQRRLDAIDLHYDRVLTNILDLEEDLNMGKINKDEFEDEREAWVQQGILLLQARDIFAEQENPVDHAIELDTPEGQDMLEELILAQRRAES